ncbi:hypothetical protein MIPYR_50088 [uncultured Microbacterium sp.]|uniref:Uncharacterized protein n=1 Tax=uncultured Microbacterium sp. TaxID=191216 RepID=A0A1Y5P5K7_9MICO|nr:hypothetical protein MIPYR_50088 [uncultured Microbacterium sp.]
MDPENLSADDEKASARPRHSAGLAGMHPRFAAEQWGSLQWGSLGIARLTRAEWRVDAAHTRTSARVNRRRGSIAARVHRRARRAVRLGA